MKRTLLRIWNTISILLVALAVLLAALLAGARIAGLQLRPVLSDSMVPTYRAGSLLFVRSTDPASVSVGQVITFLQDADTVMTRRVVEIEQTVEDPTAFFFHTKGDAAEAEDSSPVYSPNVIGTPVFSVPYLGFLINSLQYPVGRYGVILAGVVLVLLVMLPDLFPGGEKKRPRAGRKTHPPRKAVPCSMPPMEDTGSLPAVEGVDVIPEPMPMKESGQNAREALEQEVRRKTEGLLTEEEVDLICSLVEADAYDETAAKNLQRLLIARHTAKKAGG